MHLHFWRAARFLFKVSAIKLSQKVNETPDVGIFCIELAGPSFSTEKHKRSYRPEKQFAMHMK